MAQVLGDNWLIYFDQYRDKTYGAVRTSDFKHFTNISKKSACLRVINIGRLFLLIREH